jgi:hypothetical protein
VIRGDIITLRCRFRDAVSISSPLITGLQRTYLRREERERLARLLVVVVAVGRRIPNRCPTPPLFSESIKIRGVTWPALWKARKLELVSH